MKKISLFLIVIMLIATIAPQAFAATPALKVPNITIPDISNDVKIEQPDNFWDKWFNEHPLPEIELLDVPEIYTAKFVHKTHCFGSSPRLEIRWSAVDGAKSYEVLITMADGSSMKYTVSNNMIFDRRAECPRMYVEEASAWIAATVKVRAIGDGVNSLWSEEAEIGCDMMHR